MCEIVQRLERVTNKEQVAWKCIAETSSKLVWRPLTQWGVFHRNKWQSALGNPGFNCYLTRKAALDAGWTTSRHPVKVRIRKVEGYNRTLQIVFAREIFVPKGK